MANISREDLVSYPEYKAALIILKTVPPVLIIFGTIGNTLSVVVLTRKSIRNSSAALYLICLTFSDFVVLYTGLLRLWVTNLFEFDIRHIGEGICKLHTWLVYGSLDFSAWMLIAVTLERIIAVWFPHYARRKRNRKSAAALIIVILIFLLGLNSHFLYGIVHKISKNNVVKKCVSIDSNYRDFFTNVWSWIDLCVFCLIPFVIIVAGNSLILIKVFKSRQKAQSRPASSCHRTSKQFDHHTSSLTAMLFTLNTVFLGTTLPISIYDIGFPFWNETEDPRTKARLELWWAIVNMLMYTNNAINFLLYSLSGSQFRREVKRIMCNIKKTSKSKKGDVGTNPRSSLSAHKNKLYQSVSAPNTSLIQRLKLNDTQDSSKSLVNASELSNTVDDSSSKFTSYSEYPLRDTEIEVLVPKAEAEENKSPDTAKPVFGLYT